MSPPTDEPPSLLKAQVEFAVRLADRDGPAPDGMSGRDAALQLRRFNLYRNNSAAAPIEALRARHPVVERLVGVEFFNAAAHLFASQHPPRSPALLEFGGGFADFLAAFEPARPLPYLPDVARLEWLRHTAYHAPDAEPMDATELARIAPERIGGIMLRLHPSAALLTSDYPVVSIWETNTSDTVVRRIGPDMEGEAALVIRPALDVRVLRLGPAAASLLGALGHGTCLAVAAERAARAVADFSLADALGHLLAARAFSGYSLQD